MVLQVLSDARQVVNHVDADLTQVVLIADSAQKENLRTANGAGAQNHLFPGCNAELAIVTLEKHSVSALLVVDEDAVNERVQGDVQVFTIASRSQKSFGRRAPFAISHRSLGYLKNK